MRHPPKLIALDSDEKTQAQIARLFGGHFLVIQLRNPLRAMALIEMDRDVRAIITEQVMRTATGVDLLESVRTMRPEIRRVMLTGYSDLAAIVMGLHSGAIQSLVQKPAGDLELLTAVCPEVAQRAATAGVRRASA